MPFDPISFEIAKRALGRSVAMYDRNGDGFIEYIQLRKYEGSLPSIGALYELAIDPSDGYVKVFDPITSSWKVITSQFLDLGGYSGFDNNGGGSWSYYINIPITTTPSEYAQYKVVIDSTNVTVYAADDTQKAQGAVASDFWVNVKSDGSDIRAFDQAKDQLYFWIESWDYSGQNAVIWVKLPAGSTELNIAYGNPSALKSSYEEIDKVAVLGAGTDFSTNVVDGVNWIFSAKSSESYSIANGELSITTVSSYSGAFVYYNTPIPIDDYIIYGRMYRTSGYLVGEIGTYFGFTPDPTTVGSYYHDPTKKAIVELFKFESNIFRLMYHDGASSVEDKGNTGTVVGKWQRVTIIFKQSTETVKAIFHDEGDETLEVDYSSLQSFSQLYLVCGHGDYNTASSGKFDYIAVFKLADPADFGTPQILEF